MLNYIFNAFVRNDGSPSLAMSATLLSSLYNIVFDYLFMFPMKLGMAGAALATAIAPMIGVLICSLHFLNKKNTIRFVWAVPSFRRLLLSCQLGISAFVGEMTSGITTLVFNFLILSIAGNVGIAAYGIVANVALVATSVFNGLAQGAQPLFSTYYGKGDHTSIRKILNLSIIMGILLSITAILIMLFFAEPIVQIFNSENSIEMEKYAMTGIRIYFVGYLFAGFNIVGTGYLSAIAQASRAFMLSILRGVIMIVFCAVILSKLLGMTGIWLAFPVAEGITAVVMVYIMICIKKETSK